MSGGLEPCRQLPQLAVFAKDTKDKIVAPSATPGNFSYSSSFNARTQIRLLRFIPTQESADCVALTIASYDLESVPPYTALSYVWGERTGLEFVLLNGYRLHVRRNCARALRELRSAGLSLYYWIDAICINQNDLEERGHQVSMMAKIFTQADRVAISYGADDPAIEAFMARLLSVGLATPSLDMRDMNSLAMSYSGAVGMDETGFTVEEQAGLLEFVSLPYWRRMWIVQELACARAITVLTRGQCIPLDNIFGFLGLLSRRLHNDDLVNVQARAGLRAELVLDWESVIYEPMMILGQQLNFHGLRHRGNALDYRRDSLPARLRDFGSRLCEDTRDRVYAILSLVKWPSGMERIEVDYTITTLTLARRLWAYYRPARRALPVPWQFASLIQLCLHLCESGSDVLAMIASRRGPRSDGEHSCHESQQALAPLLEPWIATEGRLLGAIDKANHSYMLRMRGDGQLVLSGDDPEQLLRIRQLSSPASTFYGHTSEEITIKGSMRPLYAGSRAVGSVCAPAQAGDYLATLPQEAGNPNGASIVLRPKADRLLIIGYAILDAHLHAIESDPVPSAKREYFLLHCNADDMLTMACLWWKYATHDNVEEASERREEILDTNDQLGGHMEMKRLTSDEAGSS